MLCDARDYETTTVVVFFDTHEKRDGMDESTLKLKLRAASMRCE